MLVRWNFTVCSATNSLPAISRDWSRPGLQRLENRRVRAGSGRGFLDAGDGRIGRGGVDGPGRGSSRCVTCRTAAARSRGSTRLSTERGGTTLERGTNEAPGPRIAESITTAILRVPLAQALENGQPVHSGHPHIEAARRRARFGTQRAGRAFSPESTQATTEMSSSRSSSTRIASSIKPLIVDHENLQAPHRPTLPRDSFGLVEPFPDRTVGRPGPRARSRTLN